MDVLHDGVLSSMVWIELIGFDNTSPDYGVGSFLARLGYAPDGVSFLMAQCGFVMHTADLSKEEKLTIAEASYGGHRCCPERERQEWTNLQLKGLIDSLHACGIKVYLSFFNYLAYTDDDGNRIVDDYFADKPYLRETTAAGSQGALGMLKRFPDGSYFEDALQEATLQTLTVYGFDGLHIADGICCPRLTLLQGDFSDDMLGQFFDYTGLPRPEAKDNVELAAWILREKRLEWIRFNTARWGKFYEKFVKRLHGGGFRAVFNNAWTRDPLEAMYRYGIDYRLVAAAGVDGCMPEDVAAGLAILSENDNGYLMNDAQRRRIHYEFQTALMLNRAVMPSLRLTPLSGIHDTNEQWGVLEHMPTSMARQVMANLNCFLFTGDGFKPVTDGPFFCLSDSMRNCDWEFIRKIWDAGYTRNPVKPVGAVLLWSDRRLDRELERLCAERRTPTFKYVSELKYAGALINAVVRVEDLEKLSSPLLVTNFDLLSDDEKKLVLGYKGGIVFTLGAEPVTEEGFTTLVRENNSFGKVALCARGADKPEEIVENAAVFDFDPHNSRDALDGLWTHPLIYPPVSEEFYGKCADCINGLTGAPTVQIHGGRVCKLHVTDTSDKTCRVIVVNDDYYYNIPLIDMKRKIRAIRCVTKYEGYKVSRNDTFFSSRIPPRGAEAFEIEFE